MAGCQMFPYLYLCGCVCVCVRYMEWHHKGGSEDPEARYHVPRVFPGRGSDHEETSP